MITGELKNRIDSIWEIFWTGGLTNPLDVIEQMTYLMFIHDLDAADTLRAKESAMLGLPFARYMLGVIIAAYKDFADRVEILITKGLSKPERVREIIRNSIRKLTKAEIMAQCPDIGGRTVERALASLQESGEIIKIGGGRYTSYIWNREEVSIRD